MLFKSDLGGGFNDYIEWGSFHRKLFFTWQVVFSAFLSLFVKVSLQSLHFYIPILSNIWTLLMKLISDGDNLVEGVYGFYCVNMPLLLPWLNKAYVPFHSC